MLPGRPLRGCRRTPTPQSPGGRIDGGGRRFLIKPSGEHRCGAVDKGRMFRCDKVAQPGSKEYIYVVRAVESPTLKLIQPPHADLWIQDA